MGIRGLVKDIVLIYLGVKLLGVWIFHHAFTFKIGFLVLFMLGTSIWFSLERFGIIPK